MDIKKIAEPALVVFSGGQDSTTCLIWALRKFEEVTAISFKYNQRHEVELKWAKKIVQALRENKKIKMNWLNGNKIVEHKIVKIPFISNLLETAMIQEDEITTNAETGLPTTFVPGRNILFLTIAASWAYQKHIDNLVTGVGQTDFSGYPDCRNSTMKSLQNTLTLGLERGMMIHTPLMRKTKADTVRMMDELGDIELFKYTHTCYRGERPACGECPACKLRLKGFQEAGIEDPLEYENHE
ncbi:MAG: 7-cyano-7-deazaguanine synthase QueC [Promethearchaeia archaeon]